MSEGYIVHIVAEGPYQIDGDALQMAALQALRTAGTSSPLALTVTITSGERIQELNRQFAGIDATTDVLAFGPEGDPYAVEPGEPPYAGDVIIAYPIAEQQAREAGHSLLAEMQMLTIHGTLHLLGYDHDTPERQAEMWALQSAAMDAVRAGSADR